MINLIPNPQYPAGIDYLYEYYISLCSQYNSASMVYNFLQCWIGMQKIYIWQKLWFQTMHWMPSFRQISIIIGNKNIEEYLGVTS